MKKKYKKKYNWYIILLALGFTVLVIKGSLDTCNHYRLAKNGSEKIAIITPKVWKSLNHRDDGGYYYYYKINELFLDGHTFDQEYQPGDSIIVLYLKDNPKVNAPLYYLKRVHPSWFNKYIKK